MVAWLTPYDRARKHRLAQAQELLRIGVRLTDDTYVVAQADGQPLQPNSLTHAVRLFMKENGAGYGCTA